MKIFKKFILATLFLLLFTITLGLVLFVDVTKCGVYGTNIGLSKINLFFSNLFGYNEVCYVLSQIFTLLLVLIFGGFCFINLIKVIKSKSFKIIDKDVWIMAVLVLVLSFIYFFFETVTINLRPIILNGEVEKSFPSSHTLLSIALSGYLIVYSLKNINNKKLKLLTIIITSIIGLSMIITRTISGVHWITDIIAGIFLGLFLVFLYSGIINIKS